MSKIVTPLGQGVAIPNYQGFPRTAYNNVPMRYTHAIHQTIIRFFGAGQTLSTNPITLSVYKKTPYCGVIGRPFIVLGY
jgi:hypothetical protein